LQKFEQVRGHARYSIIEDRVILKNYRTIRYSLALYTKEHLPHMCLLRSHSGGGVQKEILFLLCELCGKALKLRNTGFLENEHVQN
jgi:hypothetical protein